MVLVNESILVFTDGAYPMFLLGAILLVNQGLLLSALYADGPEASLALMLNSDHVEGLVADLALLLEATHVFDCEGLEHFMVDLRHYIRITLS
jgi:hypothetical protein